MLNNRYGTENNRTLNVTWKLTYHKTMVKWSFELKKWDNLEKHTQFYKCTLISLLLLRHKYELIF